MTSPVKVKISEIPQEGLTLTERFNPMEMDLQTSVLRFTAPLEIRATFFRERDTVLLQVTAAGDLEIVCGRCLEPYRQPFQGHFDLDYDVRDRLVLDVTDDIRQEIFLNYPVRIICREGCRGLCPGCGKNLNEGDCSCPR